MLHQSAACKALSQAGFWRLTSDRRTLKPALLKIQISILKTS